MTKKTCLNVTLLRNITLALILATLITGILSNPMITKATPQQNLKPILAFKKAVTPSQVKDLVIEYYLPYGTSSEQDNVISLTLTYACPIIKKVGEGFGEYTWTWTQCRKITLTPSNATVTLIPPITSASTSIGTLASK